MFDVSTRHFIRDFRTEIQMSVLVNDGGIGRVSHLGRTGAWIGVGTAIGAALFILTGEPVWIGVGVAVGAGLDWRKPKSRHSDQENSD